jgi:hypothetical protein
MNVSMVVNQLKCCGIINNSSLKNKKVMVNESHAPTETSFVTKSPSTIIVAPAHSPYT